MTTKKSLVIASGSTLNLTPSKDLDRQARSGISTLNALNQYKRGLDGNQWEKYCEHLLRKEYGHKNFTFVPAEDRGDHGIEFFTADGVIYQCYFPKPDSSMADYKKKTIKKISDDLGKLEKYENEIQALLGDLEINHWILMIPEIKSRELIKKCKEKEKALRLRGLKFLDSNIRIKIETDESFPESALYARNFTPGPVHINLNKVSSFEIQDWIAANSIFHDNLKRKSTSIIKNRATQKFREEQVTQYIQLEELIDYYRNTFPQIGSEVIVKALEALERIRNQFHYGGVEADKILSELLNLTQEMFKNTAHNISTQNVALLASGHIAKWLAECDLEFAIDG